MVRPTAVAFGLAVVLASAGIPTLAAQAAEKYSARVITTKQASRQYLADVAPFTEARSVYAAAFAEWHRDKVPPSQSTAFVHPFVAACGALEHKLHSQKWPHGARSDVGALATTVSLVANDVGKLPSVDALTASAWASSLERASAASTAAANKVRSDLGLPPAA
jgi:hypothetical protein